MFDGLAADEQALGDLGAHAVAYRGYYLMGLCIAYLGVARNVQSLFLQGLGEVLGVLDYRLLILSLEGVHLVCGHQQAKLGA